MLTSKSNELIKLVNSLKEKKNRDGSGLFLVEGNKLLKDALASGFVPKHLICTQKNLPDFPDLKDIVEVSDELFAYISATKTPQGVMGIFEKPIYALEDVLRADKILYLENVQNSDNAGALIRSAVCAGYKAVLSDSTTADCYSEKSVRASAGGLFHTINYRCESGVIAFLKNNGYKIIGSHLKGDINASVQYDRSVLIIGNEGAGMSEALSLECDVLVKIPIYGPCESLNAVTAGTLLMYKTIGY